MYEEQEGPKTVVIPEQRFLSCDGCKYYSHKMIKSGWNPIYATSCNHPDIKPYPIPWGGNLPEDGRTPDWCPFVKNENL